MKRLILLLSLTALAAGCTLLGYDSEEDISTYLPLKTGATWTLGWVDSTGAAHNSGTYTIAGTMSHLGKTYWVIEESNGDSTLVRLNNDILYAVIAYSQTEIKPVCRAKTAWVGNPEQVWYKFGVAPGTTWRVSSSEVDEYVGTESVTTPAGTFADCAKFTHTFTSTSEPQYVYTTTLTEWLAPNIGLVKETLTYSSYHDGSWYELSADTEVVTAYAIP